MTKIAPAILEDIGIQVEQFDPKNEAETIEATRGEIDHEGDSEQKLPYTQERIDLERGNNKGR